jgi:hypothetical protein
MCCCRQPRSRLRFRRLRQNHLQIRSSGLGRGTPTLPIPATPVPSPVALPVAEPKTPVLIAVPHTPTSPGTAVFSPKLASPHTPMPPGAAWPRIPSPLELAFQPTRIAAPGNGRPMVSVLLPKPTGRLPMTVVPDPQDHHLPSSSSQCVGGAAADFGAGSKRRGNPGKSVTSQLGCGPGSNDQFSGIEFD